MTAVIQARGLGKRNRNRWALADCTLSIPAGHVRQLMVDKRITSRAYTRLEGQDAPEITEWKWPY